MAINPERAEFLVNQLRGKIRALKQAEGTNRVPYRRLVREVLDAEKEVDIPDRVSYMRVMEELVSQELAAGKL